MIKHWFKLVECRRDRKGLFICGECNEHLDSVIHLNNRRDKIEKAEHQPDTDWPDVIDG